MAEPLKLPSQLFLTHRGIDVAPDSLNRMLREAVSRMHRALYPADPRSDLTPPEVAALEQGGFELTPVALGMADPLARTAAEYGALLETSLSVREAARKLGVDPSRIRQRLTALPPTLYGVRLGSGWAIPEFQFEGDALLPGLSEVVSRLDSQLHPIAIFRWFTTPHSDLVHPDLEDRPVSPRDALRLGLPPAEVAELAADL
jgi:hypothetical protein